MAEYSILYFGPGKDVSRYLKRLEKLSCCKRLQRSEPFSSAVALSQEFDLVLFEAAPGGRLCDKSVGKLAQSFGHIPLVALTTRENEQRGIAAVAAGAQGYLCTDTASEEEQIGVFDRAVRRHELMSRLSETDDTVLSILRSINDGVIVTDAQGLVLDMNPAARSILGIGARETIAPDWHRLFAGLTSDGSTELADEALPLRRACSGEKFNQLLARHRRDNAPDIILSISGQGLFDSGNDLVGAVITFRDVTDIENRAAELQQRALFDELTGLANRRLFTEQLARSTGRCRRNNRALSVLFIDLDKFKSVNDTLGHDIGDELLREVAGRLTKNLRIGDFIGRWGGDEFIVCIEDFGDIQNSAAVAQKLLLLLSEKYCIGEQEIFVTASIGIANFPESGDTPDRLIKAADVAMYQAKKRGGSRFQFYSSALNKRLEQQEELEIGLRHALVRQEFVLHYQPRIDVASQRLIALEALLRWDHPRFGLLSPERFLPILESSGLIHSAGEWVIDTACRQLASWQKQFDVPDLSVVVNISPQQLTQGRLAQAVQRAIKNAGIDPGCLELEIGDGKTLGERAVETRTMQELRQIGVRLSLGHFGIGEISFGSLDTGVIDSFVLDHTLISDIMDNDQHQRIVRATIAMAQGLNIEVAAEGVETRDQLTFLRECHCDLAQGFLISRPTQAEKIGDLLHAELHGGGLLRD
jgi:diguanylate cyclase (GGDEF)-like protein/PAS domain S-box-containing protein